MSTICLSVHSLLVDWKVTDPMWVGPNGFRWISTLVQVAVVFPISCLKAVRDFFALTILQLLFTLYVMITIIIVAVQFNDVYFSTDPAIQSEMSKYGTDPMTLHDRFAHFTWFHFDLSGWLFSVISIASCFTGQIWTLNVHESMQIRT